MICHTLLVSSRNIEGSVSSIAKLVLQKKALGPIKDMPSLDLFSLYKHVHLKRGTVTTTEQLRYLAIAIQRSRNAHMQRKKYHSVLLFLIGPL